MSADNHRGLTVTIIYPINIGKNHVSTFIQQIYNKFTLKQSVHQNSETLAFRN